MLKGLFRKKEKAVLVAIDRQLQEILQMAPEIRELLQLRHVLDGLLVQHAQGLVDPCGSGSLTCLHASKPSLV